MNIKENEYNNVDSLRKNIGFFIRESRVNRSLTGGQFAKLINVSQQQVSRYENGLTNMSIDMLNSIFIVLGVEWQDFYRKVLLIEVNKNITKNTNSFPFY
ncbi:helix-turn-helix domain-containing protein [Providencia sp. Je.9.19]|uniref:helix-turn-helix domain-containing protein n=1 Tax=unclassified Providencia TaxID=2633465 RepID=UPI003DA911D1